MKRFKKITAFTLAMALIFNMLPPIQGFAAGTLTVNKPDPITVNGVEATVDLSPKGPYAVGDTVTATVTLYGASATKEGTHTVGLTAGGGLTINAPAAGVTKDAGASMTVSHAFAFTFLMPASNVINLELTHTFAETVTPLQVFGVPYWDATTPTKIMWNQATLAGSYDLQLYRNNSKDGAVVTVEETARGAGYDFAERMKVAGSQYTVSLVAKPAAGDTAHTASAESNKSDVYTAKAPLKAPINPVWYTDGGELWAMWTEQPDAYAGVDHYTVTLIKDGNTTVATQDVKRPNASADFTAVIGTTPGSYAFKVKAVPAVGSSTYGESPEVTSAAHVVAPKTPLPAPTNPIWVTSGRNLQARWTEPTSDYLHVDHYTVTLIKDGNSTPVATQDVTRANVSTGADFTAEVGTNPGSYTFKVKAVPAAGSSTYGESPEVTSETHVVAPKTQLKAPTDLKWDTTGGDIKAKWTEQDDAFANVGTYIVTLIKDGTPMGDGLTVMKGYAYLGQSLKADIGTNPGTYTFKVKALAYMNSSTHTDSAEATFTAEPYVVAAHPPVVGATLAVSGDYTYRLFVKCWGSV